MNAVYVLRNVEFYFIFFHFLVYQYFRQLEDALETIDVTIQLYTSLHCSTQLHPTPTSWMPDLKPSPANTSTSPWLLLISFQIRSERQALRRRIIRQLNGEALQSFERGYELRQHQTRIKSTNWTDPG